MTDQIVRKYGWRPDVPDFRDHKFKVSAPIAGLPKSCTQKKFYSTPYDQGTLGSCTSNAWAAYLRARMVMLKLEPFDASRLAIYYGEREIEGTINEDAGAEIRDGMKVVNKNGIAPETLWPYVVSKFTQAPPAVYNTEALKTIATVYERVEPTLNHMKAAVFQNGGFVFGFSVYESFENKWLKKDTMPMPSKTEKILGGHAVVAVGYSDAKKAFLIRNSWGTSWALSGYFWMPYDFITNTNVADDFWTVSKIN